MYCLIARLLSCQNTGVLQKANATLVCTSELFLAETRKWKALIPFYNAQLDLNLKFCVQCSVQE